ncbi:MAG: PAS domain-containing protein [Deltaproteobacteria bacterium]|nr:PAS domain-containing protein [Deltaproteobacteria bacterium]
MRDLGTKAAGAAPARIVGNLAGVVEWANDAFAQLSGIGLDETVDKPVSRLLERAGIDLEIVEFVAQHFFEGRVCRVAFPFERPDGRRIDVLLEVEALRDALGEVDRFSAIAREESAAPCASETASPNRSPSRAEPPPAPGYAVDLDAAIRRAVEAALAGGRREPNASGDELGLTVELDLAGGLERIAVAGLGGEGLGGDAGDLRAACPATVEPPAGQAIESLATALFEAARLGVAEAGNAGGVITLSTARLDVHRRFVSKVHAIPACPAERSASGDVVLEVHDTGRALPPSVLAALARGDSAAARALDPSARVGALAEACACALGLGARIHLDGTPGCGSQVLVLFEPAPNQAR